MMMNENAKKVNGAKKIDRVAMMEGYLAMAKINHELAEEHAYSYSEGMELYKVAQWNELSKRGDLVCVWINQT